MLSLDLGVKPSTCSYRKGLCNLLFTTQQPFRCFVCSLLHRSFESFRPYLKIAEGSDACAPCFECASSSSS